MIPIIDLFAGPGGLGEGFSAYRDSQGQRVFRVVLAIEKDDAAHSTLLLRSFFRQFADGKVPEEYFKFMRGEVELEKLFEAYPGEAEKAKREAWQAELGKVSESEVDQRIAEALDGAKKWLLIGGPPCQAYSLMGRARIMGESRKKHESLKLYEEDKRHFLYREYIRIIKKHTPPVFVMENVKGLLSARVGGDLIIQNILQDFKDLDYTPHSFVRYEKDQKLLFNPDPEKEPDPNNFVIRCEAHGIPQARHRVILLGIHKNGSRVPGFLRNRKNWISLWKVIGDLPRLRSQVSREEDSPENWEAAIKKVFDEIDTSVSRKVRAVVKKTLKNLGKGLGTGGKFVKTEGKPQYCADWFHDSRLAGVPNHDGRLHMASDLRRYCFAACFARAVDRSPTLEDFPKSLLPDHENVNGKVDKDTCFRDRFRVQLKNKPSTTITSHIAKDGHYFIHPDPTQCRSLTVREAARLQTFPDNYLFLGNRTQQYQQVGNAVPPLLAKQLAAIVHQWLRGFKIPKEPTNGSPDKGTKKLEHVPDPVEEHRT